MSGPTVRIRRQRCYELPLECRRQLKKLLGGAELFTRPNHRIFGDFASLNFSKKVKMQKKKNLPKKLTKNLKTENNLTEEIKNINLPLTYGEEEFLLPLSQDRDVLISADLLTTTTSKTTKQKTQKIKNKLLQNSTINSLTTPKIPTTIKITQIPLNNIKNKTKFNKTKFIDLKEVNYEEKTNKIISKSNITNYLVKLSKLKEIEIFGPPIKNSLPQQLTSEDSFIHHQPKQFQQKILEEKQIILDDNSKFPIIPPWWTFKKMSVKNEIGKNSKIEDFTNECCQWALNGLCDRSWQRIRELWLF